MQELKPEALAAREAVALLKGPVKTAELLGVRRYQTVQSWMRHGVPVEYCADLEMQCGGRLTRKNFRPQDWQRIWPELASQPHNGAGQRE